MPGFPPQGQIPSSIPAGSVTNAKLAQMAQATVKGRSAGAGTGDPTDLSQAQFTALIAALGLSQIATQADQTVLANVSGGVAAPVAINATQLRLLLNGASGDINPNANGTINIGGAAGSGYQFRLISGLYGLFNDGSTSGFTLGYYAADFRIGSAASIGFCAGAPDAAAGDTSLSRTAAGVLRLSDNAGAGAALEFLEQTAPVAGASDTARIFAVDNGSGKTVLKVIFSSGAAQVLATQP